jgi:hypothetical protein
MIRGDKLGKSGADAHRRPSHEYEQKLCFMNIACSEVCFERLASFNPADRNRICSHLSRNVEGKISSPRYRAQMLREVCYER